MKIRVFLFIGLFLVSSVAFAQLTESERRGKAIYLRGESTSGRKITALLGDLDVPSSTMTCGGCHGLRGEGKTEQGAPGHRRVQRWRSRANRSECRDDTVAGRTYP